jgi:hypothetical protein
MKRPSLTELERLALRCGVYGGIEKHKLDAARLRAQRKLRLGARLDRNKA